MRQLKRSDTGGVIDSDGSYDESPAGGARVTDQRHEEEHWWKKYLDYGSIRVKQKIEGRKKIERRESYETNKNRGSGICNGVGWLFGRQRIRSGRSHSERGRRRGLLPYEISGDSPTHFVERQSASETKS